MNDVLKSWIPKNSEVLDLGCGDGSLLASLKDNLDISGYGVDISEKNIELSLGKGLNVIEPVSYTHLTLPTNREV